MIAGFGGKATFLIIADLSSKSATALLALIVARYLGPTTYGKYATAAAVVALFMTITGIGFEQELTRRGGRDRLVIGSTFRLVMIGITLSCAGAALILAGFLVLSPYPNEVMHLIVVLGLAAVATRHVFPFRYLLLLLGSPHVVAAIQGLATLGLVAVTLFIIAAGGSVITIAYAQLAAAAVLLMVWLRWLPARAPRAAEKPAVSMFQLVRDAMPFTISNMLWIVYFNLDTFLLSLMRSADEVGIYAAVYRIIAINYVIGYALANTFTPALFDRFARDRKDYVRTARQLSVTMLIAGVLTAGALFLLASVLLLLVFGPAYASGVPIAQLLSMAVLFRMVNFGLSEILTTSDQQNRRVLLESGMLAINGALNWMLIPSFGAMGAAAATGVAEVFLFIGASICCKSVLLRRPIAA